MMNDSSLERQLKDAKKLHSEGIEGNKKAVIKANEMLSKLRRSSPEHAVIEAYYGSSLALLARDAVGMLEKEEKAREGLDALNRAAAFDPNNKEIRFLRGNVCLRLPDSYFQTAQTAVEDFTFLFKRQQADSRYLSQKQWKEVLNNLMTAYQNIGKQDKVNEVKQHLSKIK